MASEVMVEKPGESAEEEPVEGKAGMRDEVSFALTSEAGLNDSLAFPFVYLAIALAFSGIASGEWLGEWFLVDVVYRIGVGVVVGGVLGQVLAILVFETLEALESHLAKSMVGLEALAGTLLVYSTAELVGGYGFLSVFIAATVIRAYERKHDYNKPMHDIAERFEQIIMAMIMVLFGGAVATGLLTPLTRETILVAVVLVFVVRPLAGGIALFGFKRNPKERGAIAFYGIRGIGSFYYLAYGLNEGVFPQAELLWAVVGLVVLISVFIHGISATPVIQYLEQSEL